MFVSYCMVYFDEILIQFPLGFQPRDVAFQLARDLGFNNIQTTEQLINTLRNVDPMALVEATPGSMDYVSYLHSALKEH